MPKYVVTASLREAIKDMIQAGKTNTAIHKATGLDHRQIKGIRNGRYDYLRDRVRSKSS